MKQLYRGSNILETVATRREKERVDVRKQYIDYLTENGFNTEHMQRVSSMHLLELTMNHIKGTRTDAEIAEWLKKLWEEY